MVTSIAFCETISPFDAAHNIKSLAGTNKDFNAKIKGFFSSPAFVKNLYTILWNKFKSAHSTQVVSLNSKPIVSSPILFNKLTFAHLFPCTQTLELAKKSAAEYGKGSQEQTLVLTCKDGNTSLASFLLDQGTSPNSTLCNVPALYAACSAGKKETAKLLLDKGAHAQAPATQSYKPGIGEPFTHASSTPLQIAQEKGFTTISAMLKEKGAQ